MQCQEHFTKDVFDALTVDPAYGLDELTFLHASPLLLYGTYNIDVVCQAGPGGTDLSEDAVLLALKSASDDGQVDALSEDDLDVILDSIHDEYTEETLAQVRFYHCSPPPPPPPPRLPHSFPWASSVGLELDRDGLGRRRLH